MSHGVGTRLKEKIRGWHLSQGRDCDSCNSLAKTMDTSGPAWCRARFDTILDGIRDNAIKLKLPFASTVADFSAVRLVVASMLEEAITEEEEFLANIEKHKGMAFESKVDAVIRDVTRRPSYEHEHRWQWRPEVIEAHKRIFASKIEVIMSQTPRPTGLGRGIVTLAGGAKYFPAAYVLCRMLRKLGCNLPIEVWFLNYYEMDPKMISILESLGDVRCVHAMNSIPGIPRCFGGWEAKPWVIQHSAFDQVLFLDADIVPAVNPEYLFENLTGDTAAMFWPNLDHAVSYTASAEAWTILGFEAPGRSPAKVYEGHTKPTDYDPAETGQMLIDKAKAWHALEISKMLSDHSDFWFPAWERNPVRDWHSYGDTAIIPLAFKVAKAKSVMPSTPCVKFGDARGGGLHQFGPDKEVLWQHRCLPKFKVRATGLNPTNGLSHPELFTESVNELRGLWKARMWDRRDHTKEENDFAAVIPGSYFGTGWPLQQNRVVLEKDGQITGSRNCRWRAWLGHEDTLPRLVISDQSGAVAILVNDSHGWSDDIRGGKLYRSAPPWWDGIHTQLMAQVWDCIVNHNEYRLRDLAGKLVIDIGANEGTFSHYCYELNASRVISVEPNRLSYSRLVKNLDQKKSSICINAAAWPDSREIQLLSLENREGTQGEATGCSVAKDGNHQQVPTVDLMDISALAGSTADLLKLDCESAEWPILLHANLMDAKAIVAELHYCMLWDRPDWWDVPKTKQTAIDAVNERLSGLGYTVVVQDSSINGYGMLWAWRGEQCPFAIAGQEGR